MDEADGRERLYSYRRMSASQRSAASDSWRYLTTGMSDAAKALVGGNENETWEKIDSASAVNALQYKSIQENALFRAAQLNDLGKLEQVYSSLENESALTDRTEAGETAFHIAVLFDSVDVALSLLDRYPPFLHMVYTSKLYKGQHALHIAVVNQNLDLVKEFVRRGALINSPKAIGSFFNPSSSDNQVYWGEHVLSFAACTGQKDIVEFLLRKNADITVHDSQGNNLLHLLVLQPDTDLACDMYNFISSLLLSEEQNLEAMTNKKGLTPLQLAAFQGNKQLFSLILESRKEIHWTFGPVTSSIYNLKELDTFGEKNSVLDVIVRSEAKNSYELLDVQPIPQLLSEKWTNFAFFFFMAWMMLYIGYMTIFTLVVSSRPVQQSNVTWCLCPGTRPHRFPSGCPCDGDIFTLDGDQLALQPALMCSTASNEKTPVFNGAYSTSEDYVRLAGEIVVVLGAFASILWEAPDLYRRGARGYFTSVGSGAFHVASWMYAVLVCIALIMRLAGADREDIVLSLAMICGWLFTLYFARAFRFVGPYIIMCQKMIAGDILRFAIIFTAVSVGFSGALFNLFIEASPRPPSEWDSFTTSFVTAFQLATGLTDIPPEQYDTAPSSGTVVFLLIVYLVIAFILLVNLLIATMGSTHARIEAERHGLWKKQLASVILLLERRIPQQWCVRSGFDGGLVGLKPGDWYVRVEEKGTLSRKKLGTVIDPKRLSRMPDGAELLSDEDEDDREDTPKKSPVMPSPSRGSGDRTPFKFRRRPKSNVMSFQAALVGTGAAAGSVVAAGTISSPGTLVRANDVAEQSNESCGSPAKLKPTQSNKYHKHAAATSLSFKEESNAIGGGHRTKQDSPSTIPIAAAAAA
eukprot:scpid40083/ scgid4107/ Transient receptor potential cation channel subfamily V member 6; Calcium transport protein 1; Epithelial calcium channel 2